MTTLMVLLLLMVLVMERWHQCRWMVLLLLMALLMERWHQCRWKKERQRQEAVKNLLQDWTDKAGRERDKAPLQAEKARLERDKEKLRFDRAKFWGMLMEECGQEPTAEKPMAPLLLMLGEACLILQKNQSLGKPDDAFADRRVRCCGQGGRHLPWPVRRAGAKS